MNEFISPLFRTFDRGESKETIVFKKSKLNVLRKLQIMKSDQFE